MSSAANCSHAHLVYTETLIVDDFLAKCRSVAPLQCFSLPPFHLADLDLQLSFYPDGFDAKGRAQNPGFFWAVRQQEGKDKADGFIVKLIAVHGSGSHRKHICQRVSARSLSGGIYSCFAFLQLAEFTSLGLVRSNQSVVFSLEIDCCKPAAAPRPLSSIAVQGDYADCSLQCPSGLLLPAHKIYLASHSPVIHAAFRGGMAESKDSTLVISVPASDQTVRLFLRHVYEGWTPGDGPLSSAVSEPMAKEQKIESIDAEDKTRDEDDNVFELFQFATFYDVTPLALACAAALDSFLTTKTAMAAIEYARNLKDDTEINKAFRAAVKRFMVAHADVVLG